MCTTMQNKLFVPSHCLSKVNCCLFVTDWPFLFISFTFFKEMRLPVFHMHSYELNLGLCICVCKGLLSLSLSALMGPWESLLIQLWVYGLIEGTSCFVVSIEGTSCFVVSIEETSCFVVSIEETSCFVVFIEGTSSFSGLH